MAKLYARYSGKGLAFVSVDVSWDTESGAEKFVEEYHLPFPVGRDANGAITSRYGVDATPNTFFIGKDSKIVGRVDGEIEETEFELRINSLLGS